MNRQLPATGVNSLVTLLMAVSVIVTGSVIVLAVRRRRCAAGSLHGAGDLESGAGQAQVIEDGPPLSGC
ncbi:LPXTG cell wall anchor domain-containing protein [Desertimonas flava]|uniref:LPXTG cell wall anchor domain-containing protein n=1 Tax=Desertimonas flava TaxID=2064846 RepID=UPI000E34C026|nr:LPXTG cell wall anchor domain-containing protein [Desertimonas flava]